MANAEYLTLKGVRTNNLKSIDVSFPIGKYTVVTGKSGSGKSSLVFDTLYGESYRRYVESLSSFARQYMKALPKPELDFVENLPASIAVRQSRAGQSNRSTVGTMTELLDLMRIIFSHLSEVYCCEQVVIQHDAKSIANNIHTKFPGEGILIMARLPHLIKLKAAELKQQLFSQGFTRAFVNQEVQSIEDLPASKLKDSYIIVSRLKSDQNHFLRTIEACDLALKLGHGTLTISVDNQQINYSNKLNCDHCGRLYLPPTQQLFNFNNPIGACEQCQGFGRVPILDRDKVVPDLSRSLDNEGVAAWNFGKHRSYYSLAIKSAAERGLDPQKSFSHYSKAEWQWLYSGDSKGRFKGIEGYFAWLDRKKYKAHYRIHAARFHSYRTCPSCEGKRLRPESLACKLEQLDMAAVGQMPLKDLTSWVESLKKFTPKGRLAIHAMGVIEAIDESLARLYYLNKIGLHYLNLERPTRTLSGGEVQRINLARSLGSNLTDTLFCLDEPSSGLHPRDSQNLLDIICELRDQGNTVVIVEHELGLIRGADNHLVIGPGAGFRGGQVSYAGPPWESATAPIKWQPIGCKRQECLAISQASIHNLKGIDAKIPTQALTVVCGVSGSGKTSLIRHTLYPLVCQFIGKAWVGENEPQGTLEPRSLVKRFKDVILVGQEGLGRSSRSNIATYLGIFTEVRKLFSQTIEARSQNLSPGYFSFNVAGGRCETCKGLGLIEEDLSFLGNMEVICPECQGLRFQSSVLNIRYREKNLLDILKMTVSEAQEFFYDNLAIKKVLDLVAELGMDYMTLGQHTSSFSGGEGQRLKILSFLLENKDKEPRLFIFDEPSTGLSDQDVLYLIEQFKRLLLAGHTLVVVEHHHGIIQSADWVLELGPEAADDGGDLVFSGTVAELLRSGTITGQYITRLDH